MCYEGWIFVWIIYLSLCTCLLLCAKIYCKHIKAMKKLAMFHRIISIWVMTWEQEELLGREETFNSPSSAICWSKNDSAGLNLSHPVETTWRDPLKQEWIAVIKTHGTTKPVFAATSGLEEKSFESTHMVVHTLPVKFQLMAVCWCGSSDFWVSGISTN